MLLALEPLSTGWQALIFGIAFALLVLAALSVALGRINLAAAGLACFVFVFAWNALAAS